MLYAIANDRIDLLKQLIEYAEFGDVNSGSDSPTDGGAETEHTAAYIPRFMTQLMLTAQCGRYETVKRTSGG